MNTCRRFHGFIAACVIKRVDVSEVSSFSTHTAQAKVSPRNSHCYKELYAWKTRSQFASHLCESVVYCKDGVVALNKPYGVRIYKKPDAALVTEKKQDIRHASLLSSQEDFPYSIEDVLPEIRSTVGCHDLRIVKAAERYTSGIVLLSANEKISEKLVKSVRTAKVRKVPHLIHWAITRGCPIESARREEVGMKMVDIEFRNEKHPIIETVYSKRDVKRKLVKPVLVEYRTLTINAELSTTILEIASTSTTWHFVRVYASSRAASILGDMFYGGRMRTILGKPVKINPHNMAAYDRQPLPMPMCQRLQLQHTVEGHETVPTMLHLQTLLLPAFNKQDICITAPPPKHFQWTCAQLGLLPEEVLHKQEGL